MGREGIRPDVSGKFNGTSTNGKRLKSRGKVYRSWGEKDGKDRKINSNLELSRKDDIMNLSSSNV